jgi:CheY-like chemotaxis protein
MLAETRERADTATARVVALEHERDALRVAHAAETAALQDEIAALTTECQQLRDDAPTSVAVPADGGLDDEDVEPAAADADPGDAPTFEPCPQLIVVLDHEAAWQDVSVDKYDLLVVAPGDDIVTRLAPTWPGRILANLAVPGTLKTLLALRATGAPTRMWGCIANGAGDHALPLGAIEPAARPLAPDAVLAALAAHLPAGGRVVTVGADVDALLSLRQALARQGMSVSLAWDAKQANELLEMVHPDVVVTDLGAPDDAYTVIAHLAASDPIPTAVLIDGASDVAAGFAAILGAPAIKHRLTSRQQLLGGIVGGPVRKPAGPARPAARPRL